jgi:hypothetical protein
MKLQKATRSQVKLRLGLSAVSGGGKTYSALLMAYGMTNDWEKIAVIDTENNSASLYANLGGFLTYDFKPPYTPERYVEAIKMCEDSGIEVIIIDSVTHEWDGKGGILEISNAMSGNSYTNWAKITPRHDAFISAIMQSKCHVITTVRRKQDYELTKNSEGKVVPIKVGLKEITREGFEYELTLNLNIESTHYASASKDRTGLFMDKPEFIISKETGKQLIEWCNSGKSFEETQKEEQERYEAEVEAAILEAANSKDVATLTSVWKKYTHLQNNTKFAAKVKEVNNLLTPTKTPTENA